MFEKIVVALDGSSLSEITLSYVEKMLSRMAPEVQVEAILILVNTRPSRFVVVGGEFTLAHYSESEIALAEKQSQEYLNNVGDRLRTMGAKVTIKVPVGDACEEIIKAAEESNADLIVMSSHGRSGISRWAFGSVTDKVLRHEGTVPVLMVKATQTDKQD